MKLTKYNTIYADPPWSYSNPFTGAGYKRRNGTDVVTTSRAIEKYPTMTLEEICAMPIPAITSKRAVLFLWVTTPLMPEGMEVMKAWGFKYKTMLTWRKVMSLGLGSWFRGQTEHILVGVRGRVRAFNIQKPNFYQSKAGKHSEKPHYFREVIMEASTNSFKKPKRLEVFARSKHNLFGDDEFKGWDVYGNQVNGSIILPKYHHHE